MTCSIKTIYVILALLRAILYKGLTQNTDYNTIWDFFLLAFVSQHLQSWTEP